MATNSPTPLVSDGYLSYICICQTIGCGQQVAKLPLIVNELARRSVNLTGITPGKHYHFLTKHFGVLLGIFGYFAELFTFAPAL